MVIFEILSGAIGFSIDIVFQDGVDSFGSMRLSCCEVLEQYVVEVFFGEFAELQIVFAAFESLQFAGKVYFTDIFLDEIIFQAKLQHFNGKQGRMLWLAFVQLDETFLDIFPKLLHVQIFDDSKHLVQLLNRRYTEISPVQGLQHTYQGSLLKVLQMD